MLSEAGIDASKVSVLDKGEMVKTEGEFWGLLVRIIFGVIAATVPTGKK